MADYKSLNNSLENAMSTTLSKWDRQDKIEQVILPDEISSLLQAFLSLIKAYLSRVEQEKPVVTNSDWFATQG